jgi:ATP-binding cassette, subfamily B, multidrug efflux pump
MINSNAVKQLKSITRFVEGLRWRYAVGALLLLLTNGMALLVPWLLKLAVEGLRAPQTAKYSAGSLAMAIASLAFLHCMVRIFSRTTILHAARIIEFRIREQLFGLVVGMDLTFFTRERTGDIMSKLTNDLTNVRMLCGFGSMSAINTLIMYVAALWLMASISLPLTIAAVLPLPLMVLTVRKISNSIFSKSLQAQEELSNLTSLAEESVSAVRLIKAYCREDGFTESFAGSVNSCLRKNLELSRLRGLVVPVMVLATGAGSLAVLYLGGRMVISGGISLGDFVAFSGYLALLAWPTAVLGWMLTLLQRGAASMERINQLLEQRPQVVRHEDGAAVTGLATGIQAKNLRFCYGDTVVLEQVSFKIRAGEKVGITGPVGSGKSTLLKLLPRLIPLEDGKLFWDGVDLNRLDLVQLRSQIGYMPQESFLFSRTIAENISYGGDSGALDLIVKQSGLSTDLAGFVNSLETVVGERGVSLSGGQRQRVALARALIREPSLLLLDDPLAAVDAGREDEILSALMENWQGRTVLMVSQRLSAFRDCDRVLVLDEGKIVEEGAPQELLQKHGKYAELARLQGITK